MAITVIRTPDAWHNVRTPVPLRIQADPTWDINNSYLIRALIQTENTWLSGTFTDLDSIEEPPGTGDFATWNLSNLMRSLQPVPTPPSLTATPAVEKLTNAARRYRIIPYEVIDGVATAASTLGPFVAVPGATPGGSPATLNRYRQAGQFLTMAYRNGKRVTQYQPEWLSYIIPAGTTSVTVRYEITYETGSPVTVTTSLTLGSLVAGDIVRFPTGYTQLNLGSAGLPVRSWRVWLINQSSTQISEVMKYELERLRYSGKQRFYVFRNGLGGWDTLRTTGSLQVQRKQLGDTVQTITDPMNWIGVRTKSRIAAGYERTVQADSGYLQAPEANWAFGIMDSEDVYRIGEEYLNNPRAEGTLLPIVLEPDASPEYDDEERLKRFQFSYTEGYRND